MIVKCDDIQPLVAGMYQLLTLIFMPMIGESYRIWCHISKGVQEPDDVLQLVNATDVEQFGSHW